MSKRYYINEKITIKQLTNLTNRNKHYSLIATGLIKGLKILPKQKMLYLIELFNYDRIWVTIDEIVPY